MAGAKAKKIEGTIHILTTGKWRQCIGATAIEGKAAKPNRLTYHWVKGARGLDSLCGGGAFLE